jgi:hypothetical protein
VICVYDEIGNVISALQGIKRCSAAFRAWRSNVYQGGTSKMLYVPASRAFPRQRPPFGSLFDLPENRICLVTNRFECRNQRLVRLVHKFNSNCLGLLGNLRDIMVM